MKKFLLPSILCSVILNAGVVSYKSGWNLKAANEDINLSATFKNNIDAVWQYIDNKWYVYLPNNQDLMNNLPNGIYKLDKVHQGYGYWIKANSDITVNTKSFNPNILDKIKDFDTMKTYLKGVKLYTIVFDDTHETFIIDTLNFDDNFIKENNYTLLHIDGDDIDKFKFIGVDKNRGIIVLRDYTIDDNNKDSRWMFLCLDKEIRNSLIEEFHNESLLPYTLKNGNYTILDTTSDMYQEVASRDSDLNLTNNSFIVLNNWNGSKESGVFSIDNLNNNIFKTNKKTYYVKLLAKIENGYVAIGMTDDETNDGFISSDEDTIKKIKLRMSTSESLAKNMKWLKNLSLLEGKVFYTIDGDSIRAIKFDNKKLKVKYIKISNISYPLEEVNFDNYNYYKTYDYNGSYIKIYDVDDDEKDEINRRVFSGSLENVTLDIYDITNTNVENTIDYLLKNFNGYQMTFTKGKMFCNLLYEECYFDLDGINEILKNLKSGN